MGHKHHKHQVSGKNIGIAVLLNIIITVSELIGGLLSGSISLLTDALHNFSDVVSLLLSYFTNRLARRQADEKHTFGYKRAEILAAFINSATLIGIAVFLMIEAVQRVLNPEPLKSDLVIYFALASVVINILSVLILHKDAKESMNIKSAYLHLLTDMMTSVAVVVGGILMKFFGAFWVDGVLSVLIAAYLIYASYHLLIASIKILMEFSPEHIDLSKIEVQIKSISEIKNIHHMHIWQLTEKEFFLDAHIDLKKDISISRFEQILDQIEQILHQNKVQYFNIQPEFKRQDKKNRVYNSH